MATKPAATAVASRVSSASPFPVRLFLAELLGTAFLTLIGCGTVTATDSLDAASKHQLTISDLGIIGLAFGLALAISIYTIGKVSGSHVNPAVTLGMAVSGRIKPVTALLYIVAQLVGAALAGLAILVIFGSHAATATSMGVTSFGASTSPLQAAAIEAIGTFIFLFVITAMAADSRAPSGWAGLIIGLTLAAVIMAIGSVTGGSLNPARSFGPELIKSLFGGAADWSQYWVYVAGPIVGAVLGVLAYDFVANTRKAK